MKKSKNGFMLVETLVVTTLVSTTLIFLYVQFNNLTNSINRSMRYNSTDNLYALNNIKEIIVNANGGSFYDSLKLQLAQNVNNNVSNFLEIYTDCSSLNNNYSYQISNCTTLSFDDITNFYHIQKIIFTYDFVGLSDNDYNNAILKNDPNLTTFIKSIKNKNEINIDADNNIINYYRLIVKFNDNEFATLRMS